jgi:hypothetical protein
MLSFIVDRTGLRASRVFGLKVSLIIHTLQEIGL